MLIPVIRLLVPLDALHSASRIDTTRLKLSAPLGVCVSETIWSRSSCWAVSGSAASTPSACWAIVAGSATSPKRLIPAISAGKTARKAA